MKRKTSRIILSVLMAFTMVLSGLAMPASLQLGTQVAYAAETRQASSWEELRNAITDSQNGDIVEITQDIVAAKGKDKNGKEFTTIDVSGGKTVTIKAAEGKNVTIYRKEGDADFPMFKTSNANAKIILGEGLTLSGKTDTDSNCGGSSTSTGEFKVIWNDGKNDIETVTANAGDKLSHAAPTAPDSEYPTFKGWKWVNPETGVEEGPATEFTVPSGKYGTVKIVAQWEKPAAGGGDSYLKNGKKQLVYDTGGRLQLRELNKETDVTKYVVIKGIDKNGVITVNVSGLTGDQYIISQRGILQLTNTTSSYYVKAHSDTKGTVATTSSDPIYLYSPWPEGYITGFSDSGWSTSGDAMGFTLTPLDGGSGGGKPTPYTSVDPSWTAQQTTPSQQCDDCKKWTKNDFSSGTPTDPNGFFVKVTAGTVTLAGAILEDFVTSDNKDQTPKHVAPVAVVGSNSKFIVEKGSIKNNIVGYLAKDDRSTNGANKIKMYIKGAAPNARRKKAPEPADGTKKRRNSAAEIDGVDPGSGVTGTAGAIIYAAGAQGEIKGGSIDNNRADTGGVMVTGEGSLVRLKAEEGDYAGADISKNVGVQFGGGTTVEQGGAIIMEGGKIHDNVAWFGGGAVFATQNGVKWLIGDDSMSKSDRIDGYFTMIGGEIFGNNAFTRGGGLLVDSNGVALMGGEIHDNTSRVQGGGAYVMGDHKDYSYTLYIDKGEITNNEAVDAGQNEPTPSVTKTAMSKKLNAANPCGDNGEMFGSSMSGTSDDLKDFQRINDGTGGGVWTCSYGSTVLDLDSAKVWIHGNQADGSTGNMSDSRTKKNEVGGQDFHSDNGGDGTLLMINATASDWKDENTNETYSPGEADAEIRNLTFEGSGSYNGGVKIYNNASRRGGGLAADGTFVFGEKRNAARITANLEISKIWDGNVTPKSVMIQIGVEGKDDKGNTKKGVIRDLELDGIADTSADEESIYENEGTTNSWSGGFNLPVTVDAEDGSGLITVFKLLGPDGTEYNPSSEASMKALASALESGSGEGFKLSSDAKLTFTELVKQEDGSYKESDEFKFTPGEVEVKDLSVDTKKVYRMNAQGEKEFVLSVSFATVPLEAELRNEAPGEEELVEKYINNKVHQSLEDVDEVFTYSVMAYVPKDATEVTITDKLENTLEFVNKTPSSVLDSVTVFRDNDHLGDGKGTVATGKVNGVDVKARDAATVAKNGRSGCPVTVDGQTVTLKLDEAFINEVRTTPKDGVNGEGFWVRVNFKAKYSTDVIATIKASYIGNDDLKAVKADKLAYIKENGEVKWNASGKRYILLVDGVYYRSNETTEGTAATSWEKHPNQDQWKTQFAGLKEADSKVIAGDVSKIPLPYNGYVLNAQEPHKGTPNQADYKVTKGNGSTSTYKTNIVTVDVEKPEVEKYVNNKVHDNIVNFDEEFEYSVLAYVPEEATKVVLSDTLNKDLEFVTTDKTKVLTSVVIYKESTHKGDGSGAGKDQVFNAARIQKNERTDVANIGLSGQKVSLTLKEAYLKEVRGNAAFANAKDKGFWVKMSFKARIKTGSYEAVAKKIKDVEDGKANADATDTSISWEKVLKDESTIDKDGKSHSKVTDGKDVESDKSHAGLANKAEYKVTIANQGESKYETNTVTVKPETTKVYAKKTWKDAKGKDAAWPTDVKSVTVKVFRSTEGQEDKEVGEITVKKDSNPAYLEGLPKLKNSSYSVEEVAIPGYTQVGSVEGSGTEDDPYILTNQKFGGPQIEKYVNNKVHNDNEAFDTSFKYDIIAYVPEDADEIVIKDTLVNALEFAKAPAGGTLTNSQTVAATASTKPDEVVTAIVVKNSNDHTVNGTVKKEDGKALGSAAVPTINGQTLTVKIADAKAHRGKYIQVTFWAKYTQEMIDAAKVGDSKTINGNGAVLGGQKSHTGTTNDASYDIRVGNEWTKDVKSNTVTVKSKTVKLEAEKKWQNADGSEAEWPDDVDKVAINVLKDTDDSVVDTIELTAQESKKSSKELPVLVGATYKLDEVTVPGYTTTVDGTVFTNKKQPNKPEIEKYINKDVDAHLVEFDKAFTYDIIAFVPEDAESIEITDTLVAALEFAEGPVDETKAAVASTDEAKVVSSVVAKKTNDHTANGTVAGTDGTAVSGAECEIDGQTLTVTIANAKAYRGQWIQVTFAAKYTQAAINAAKVANSETVTDNGTVISSITEHDGTANKASYKIKVGNTWSSDYESNTVTHDAETTKVEAEKKWKNADGTDATWPTGVASVKVKVINDKTKKEVATITLTEAKPKAESKELPKLIGVTYSIKENQIKGYISRVNGNIVTNTEGEGPEVEKYVNNNVTYDFDNFNQTFEYEIMGFVTKDATEAKFTDELNSVLEFVGDGNIKVYDMGTENDHKSTVAKSGTDVTPTSAKAENGKLEVSFDTAAITQLRERWLKVTFEARISEAGYKAVAAKVAEKAKAKNRTAADDAIWSNIDDNDPVEIKKTHDGVSNQAKLYMNTENNGEFNLDTNTVTVEPKTEQLKATKAWKNADGSAMKEWPAGVKVTFALMKGETEVETKKLSKAGTVTFSAQPKLEGVTYKVVEKSVTGINAIQDGNATDKNNTWTFTNKLRNVKFSKTDLGGTELEGAKIKLTDEDGNVIEEWDSTKEAHELNLKPGKYVMEEVVAPVGYKRVTTEIEFEVKEDGSIKIITTSVDNGGNVRIAEGEDNHLILEDAPVKVVISKEDLNGNELDDAVIKVTGPDGFEETWTSKKDEPKTLENLKPGRYELVEVVAPEGFQPVTTTIVFEVDEDGNVEVTNIREENGGGSRSFTKDEIDHIVVEDAPNPTVKISKTDLGGNELDGAVITLTDENGKMVDNWTSTKEAHEVTLKPGKYFMKEVVAPEGFNRVTTVIEFEVDENGKVTVLTAKVDNGGAIKVIDLNHLILTDAPAPTFDKTVNGGKDLEITSRDEIFKYNIAVKTSYVPEKKFVITDDVPAQIEILGLDNVSITVNGVKLSDEIVKSITAINGNKLTVTPTLEMMKEWGPFSMDLEFACKFKANAKIKAGEAIKNVALLELDNNELTYEGGDNEAEVLPAFEDENPVGVETGDNTDISIWIALMLLTAAVVSAFVIRRRRADR